TSSENAVEEVEQEDELRTQGKDSSNAHQHVEVCPSGKGFEVRPRVISSRETCNTDVVHREEYHVDTDERDPEVYRTQAFVHHATEHLREPVINTREHSEERRTTHHKLEVRNNEVGIEKRKINQVSA